MNKIELSYAKKPRLSVFFKLGRVVATPAAFHLMEELKVNYTALLNRHATFDWGDIDIEAKQENDDALDWGDPQPVTSSYILTSSDVIMIETNSDRSVTTMMLPEDH